MDTERQTDRHAQREEDVRTDMQGLVDTQMTEVMQPQAKGCQGLLRMPEVRRGKKCSLRDLSERACPRPPLDLRLPAS